MSRDGQGGKYVLINTPSTQSGNEHTYISYKWVHIQGLGGGGCVGAPSLTLQASSCNQCLGRPFRVSYEWCGWYGNRYTDRGVQGAINGLVRETIKLPGKES